MRTDEPQAGIAAQWPTICLACGEIVQIGDRVFFRRGQAVHVGCQSGADDE